ncbi:TonB-dependent siderophore receptor [Caulobacter sp. S45]|uniref:TonB-dependent receptor n=1 Tax=Caulobacter sp. S45 TaxID=1641861 RepID=UPI00131E5634|nr:TonB-dependent receptor [Caulobacter sp. S45]
MNLKAVLGATVSLLALATQTSLARAQDNTVSTVVVTAPRTTPLDQVVSIDKTGTPIQDQPRSIQIVPRELIDEQGGIKLTDTLRNVSGVTQGGQFAFGFFDRVIIRGLNATYLNDGLPDGTSDLTGVTHSLTGVERVEVLKGPGSALYGSTEEGGTINLVHYRPSDAFDAGLSEQYGSHNTTTTDVFATGPTGLANVDYRVDGEYERSDGFRGLSDETGEFLGALRWRPAQHDVELRFEYHHLENTPDATGIPFSPPSGTGKPIQVPVDDTYSTPYAFANQDIERLFLTDAWTVNDYLTVNLRGAYTNRDVDLARNAGGTVKLVGATYALTSRQLRHQEDHFGDLNLQAEPTWRFNTGSLKHVLVTGFEVRRIDGDTERSTADLPNINNILAPVVNDGSFSSLSFKCDNSHSCDDANLSAHFYSLYAIDQIDVTDALKVRLSVRQDWFDTEGDAKTLLPANPGQEQPCNPPQLNACPWVPGQPIKRDDSLVSYDVGLVYFLTPALSVFGGYSSDAYPIFNTEEPESIGQTPERGTQFEGGVRFERGAWLSLSTSLYRATRDNVFTFLTEPAPGGTGNIDVAQVFSYRVQGWETDLNLRPTHAWNVIANLAVQDPTITNYPATPADVGHGVPSVPSLLANAFTTYDLHLPITGPVEDLQFAFGARYRNHEFADAAETRLVPGAPLFDVAVSIPHDRWTASVGVKNILDRRNFLYGDGTGGGALPGDGRTAYVRLSAKL